MEESIIRGIVGMRGRCTCGKICKLLNDLRKNVEDFMFIVGWFGSIL